MISLVVFLSSTTFAIFASSMQDIRKIDILVPGPFLDATLFQKLASNGAMIEGKPMNETDKMPPALLVSQFSTLNNKTTRQVVFTAKTFFNATAENLFENYAIPVYHTPSLDLLANKSYSPPTFLVEQKFGDKSSNEGYFILSPIIDRLYRNMTISIDGFPTLSKDAIGIKQIKATFDIDGRDVGFSFGISHKIPPEFQIPPPKSFNSSLFLNIDYLGKVSVKSNTNNIEANFSDNRYFHSSPTITLITTKSLNAKKLQDGCPVISAGVFDEQTKKWKKVVATREELLDSLDICAYNLYPGHFSKFAVGGVVPPIQF
jgi:hypothetical protein